MLKLKRIVVDGTKILYRLSLPGKGLQSTGCKSKFKQKEGTPLSSRKKEKEKETDADEGKSDTNGKESCLHGWISLWDKRRGHLMR